MLFAAPLGKHPTLAFGSSDSGDLQDVGNAEHLQLANLPCPCILVWEPPADELKVFSARWVLKNRNALCDPTLHEVGRFERASAVGIDRQDDDVGGGDRFVFNDESPSRGAQNRFPNGAKCDDR